MPTPRYLSPLRYPGGKSTMAPYLGMTLDAQSSPLDISVLIEPFGGGLGAGLHLLHAEMIEELWFSENNPALVAFWTTFITDPHGFTNRVRHTAVDLDRFYEARALVDGAVPADPETLALAAFIVNRCSRSGIIHPSAGPIGGKSQAGRWKVGDRFDANRLADRLEVLAPLTRRMRFIPGSGIKTVADLSGTVGVEDEVFMFVDPPYIRQGSRLYDNGFTAVDHQHLADALHSTTAHWLLTYDAEPMVATTLYPDCPILEFSARYTANTASVGREYAVFAPQTRAVSEQFPPMPRSTTQWINRPSCIYQAVS